MPADKTRGSCDNDSGHFFVYFDHLLSRRNKPIERSQRLRYYHERFRY
jgi:hypothetical protein